MSDSIKHECGIVLLRLLKPLEYYQAKYGSWKYGLNKLYLLMEKQHNRGQDGAGVACCKLDMEPGEEYLKRARSNSSTPIKDVFAAINEPYVEVEKYNKDLLKDANWAKQNTPFAGEIYLGHLRYGTFGKNDINACHPVKRENNWKTRNLVIAGNFNLANMDMLFSKLLELGQHPKGFSDIVTIIEKIGHFLDRENQNLFNGLKSAGISNTEISNLISDQLDMTKVLREACKYWDGGFAIAGIIGNGDAFITRDPWGIRPAFYYHDDEIAVITSERPVLQTAFNLKAEQVQEVPPGHAIVIKNSGKIIINKIREDRPKRACSFERIYFSRGSDKDIYTERKNLGKFVLPQILKEINYDIENSVFSYIPNTAETAFYGIMEGVNEYLNNVKKEKILHSKSNLSPEEIDKILSIAPRIEKIAIKDAKLRTFITEDKSRDDLVNHVYDVTYGIVNPGQDNLIVIDDSIVRGTTLKNSIFKILDRLNPKKIIIVSSAPQIRYPDCYGIDMAILGHLCAFNAAIELLKERNMQSVINDVYKKCVEQVNNPIDEMINYVSLIYAPFTDTEISAKISQMLKPKDIHSEIAVIFQTVDGLRKSIPNHTGDWYFTGDYPTPGGNRAVNRAFINYIEGKNERAY
ncbi:MAG: amidophosphoribosyltransferase [Bacteroidales bacterium]|nr:amidophosphoribosyltransferase [Bacteroidales bacterium]